LTLVVNQCYNAYTVSAFDVIPIPIPTPFESGATNVYLLTGAEPALVDAGPRLPRAREALQDGLAQNGLRVEDLRTIIITHAHVDHYGLARELAIRSGARVLSHRRSIPWLASHGQEDAPRLRFFQQVLEQAGVPDTLIAAAGQAYQSFTPLGDPVDAESLQGGERLWLGAAYWTVVHTPGHASGHICLYQPERHLLLSGDHLLRDISSNPLLEPPMDGESTRPCSLRDYLWSLAMTAELDVDIVWPAHGRPIYDHRQVIAALQHHHHQRKELIYQLLHDGPKTAYDLSMALFPHLDGGSIFLGISEVIGHLDLLEDESRLVQEERAGVIYYRRG